MILAIGIILIIFYFDIISLVKQGKFRDIMLGTGLFLAASVFLLLFAAGVELPSLMAPFADLYKKGFERGIPGFF